MERLELRDTCSDLCIQAFQRTIRVLAFPTHMYSPDSSLSIKPSKLGGCFQRRPITQRYAFTLIELLTVMSIMAVLAALIFSAMGSARGKGDATKCVSNLRQIGTSIQNYVGDNDGQLPGPLQVGVFPYAGYRSAWDIGSLTEKLAKYVPSARLTNGVSLPAWDKSVFACPSSIRAQNNSINAPCFFLNFYDVIEEMNNQPPWGMLEDDIQPVKMGMLTTWSAPSVSTTGNANRDTMNLSTTWAIVDADRVSLSGNLDYAASLPKEMVHGDYRNALFYDWHVGKLEKANYFGPVR